MKINILLNKNQKKELGFIVFLSIIGGFLETFSISIIIPYMSIVVDPGVLTSSRWGRILLSMFSDTPFSRLLIYLTLILMAAFLIKNVFLHLLYILLRKFTVKNFYLTSSKLFHAYLIKPYGYFTDHNSSEIMSVITHNMGKCFALIQALLSIFTEMVVLVLLLFVMLFMNWRITILTFLLTGSISVILKKLITPKLTKIGRESNNEYIKMLKAVKESIDGIKEIKLMQREKAFLDIYNESGEENVRLEVRKAFYSNATSRIVETVTVWEILIFILIILILQTTSDALFTQLTAMALVVIRLMPCMTRINNQISIVSHSKSTFIGITDEIEEYLESTKDINDTVQEMDFSDSVCVNNISFRYPNTDKNVLSDITFTIKKGDKVGIIGSSGSGKSTLVDLIMGYWKVSSGSITVDGTDIHSNLKGWFKHIGYIPQTIFLLDGTIYDNIAFGSSLVTEERVWKALEQSHLDEFVKTLPKGIYTDIGENGIKLSGGQRQRLGIARALFNDPDVIVFDEATSALNMELETEITDTIYELADDKTIIMIAHRHTSLKGCDYIIEVEDGKIRKLNTEEILEKKYETEITN